MKFKTATYLTLILASFGLSVPLFAHHGTGVAYETEKTLTMKGTVTEWIGLIPIAAFFST